jgi:3-hydroxyacyl-CoA dehydrogenase
LHTLDAPVLDGLLAAIDAAESNFAALVIWQTEPPFSAGADLRTTPQESASLIERFQLATRRLRYSLVPTVAAVDGLALGGGCELLMHCDRTVATLESYIGLVEAGIGLLPAGGGCKELALRAAREARGGTRFLACAVTWRRLPPRR